MISDLNYTPVEGLETKPATLKTLLTLVAKARGCEDEEAIKRFFSDCPEIPNRVGEFLDFEKAATRIKDAITQGQTIVVFGDYDVDGVTSTAQMVRFLKDRGAKVYGYIPDRMTEGYGLGELATTNCIDQFRPNLVITVDCGSLSHASIEVLAQNGTDTVVMDHHQVDASMPPNPALAHINPTCENYPEYHRICASALVYFFCEAYCRFHREEWPQETFQRTLAGLGTLCDVMPLVGVNRSLVKHSLSIANSPECRDQLPGLFALAQAASLSEVTCYAYGFVIGPALNSAGRIDHAEVSLEVLTAKNVSQGLIDKAKSLIELNERRKKMQETILDEAMEQAKQTLQKHPGTKVLCLRDKKWHPGVIGIVASRCREQFDRPVFVCGFADGTWKGSGRSVENFALGKLVHNAVHDGKLAGGGGHDAAAGISIKNEEDFSSFEQWIEKNADFDPFSYRKKYEVLGNYLWSTPQKWVKGMDFLKPFGNGNPTPSLLLPRVRLVSTHYKTRKSDGSPWAKELKVVAFEDSPEKIQTFNITWNDLEKADQLIEGRYYDFIVQVSQNEYNGRYYLNTKVEAASESLEALPWEVDQSIGMISTAGA